MHWLIEQLTGKSSIEVSGPAWVLGVSLAVVVIIAMALGRLIL
jgi:hypothetical protein